MDLDDDYNRIFIRKPVNDEASNAVCFEIPTLHMILLYCEWFIREEALTEIVSLIIKPMHTSSRGKFDLEKFNGLLDDATTTLRLRDVIGHEIYDYACAAIGDGEVSIPLGLAPSFGLFTQGCSRCSTPKYLRRFCLHCGYYHADEKRVNYETPYKRKRLNTTANDDHKSKPVHHAPSVPSKGKAARLPNGLDQISNQTGTIYDPKTNSSTAVKAFSLQQLLAMSRSKEIVSAPLLPAVENGEVEEVKVQKEVVVIDLMDSSDDEPTVPHRNVIKSGHNAPQLVVNHPVTIKPDPDALPKPTTISTCIQASQRSQSRSSSELALSPRCEDSEDRLLPDVAEDALQVAVKMEWPARRMDKYAMAAMRGIASLYKYAQSGVNPGDMLFLMRNLATNCTDLHRIAARRGFQKLCKKWAEEHGSLLSKDATNDVLDVIEGTFTLAQLINPANKSWAMYQETDIGSPDTAGSSATEPSSVAPAPARSARTDFVPLATSTSASGEGAVWEDAEGKQESETDFASRVDYALSCSNLRFMIYSLTGDRRYYTLKSDPSEGSVGTVDLQSEGTEENGAVAGPPSAKRQRTAPTTQSQSNGAADPYSLSAYVDYPPDYVAPAKAARQSTTGSSRSSGSQPQLRVPDRRANPARASKLALWENLAEEFGAMDQSFGQVSEEIAKQYMEYAAVVASNKVFIKENLKYTSLTDFIGIDLDKFALPNELSGVRGALGMGRSFVRGRGSSASLSSSSSSRHTGDTGASGRCTRHGLSLSGENCIDSSFHGRQVYTGALCWPYITEEIGFDADLRIDKTLVGYQVKRSTLSKAVSNLTRVRVYRGIEYFTSAHGVLDREAYKQQCYLATHVVYAFSDWGQHALRRALFAEEFAFFVTNFAAVLDTLKDPELVGEFMHCLRILQYTPERDPGLQALFDDGRDFLLRVEKEFGSVGRWVAMRSQRKQDIYTQYHATYCAVVGLADCHFALREEDILEPPVPRLLHHLRSEN